MPTLVHTLVWNHVRSDTVFLRIVAAASISNKVTELRPLNVGGLYSSEASIFKSLLHTVTRWYLNVTFLSVDIIGHFGRCQPWQV